MWATNAVIHPGPLVRASRTPLNLPRCLLQIDPWTRIFPHHLRLPDLYTMVLNLPFLKQLIDELNLQICFLFHFVFTRRNFYSNRLQKWKQDSSFKNKRIKKRKSHLNAPFERKSFIYKIKLLEGKSKKKSGLLWKVSIFWKKRKLFWCGFEKVSCIYGVFLRDNSLT